MSVDWGTVIPAVITIVVYVWGIFQLGCCYRDHRALKTIEDYEKTYQKLAEDYRAVIALERFNTKSWREMYEREKALRMRFERSLRE